MRRWGDASAPTAPLTCIASAVPSVALQMMLPASGPSTPAGTALWLPLATFAGYAVFWSGVCVGFVNLGSGCVRACPFVCCIELEHGMHSTQPQLVLLGLAEPPSFLPPCFPFCLYAPPAEFVWASPVARAPWQTPRTTPSSSRSSSWKFLALPSAFSASLLASLFQTREISHQGSSHRVP